MSLRIHGVSLHFLVLFEDMGISTGTSAATFNFTFTVVSSTLHITFFIQSECWWKCLSWRKYLKHHLLQGTVSNFYLLEIIEVVAMLFCVLKWPVRDLLYCTVCMNNIFYHWTEHCGLGSIICHYAAAMSPTLRCAIQR